MKKRQILLGQKVKVKIYEKKTSKSIHTMFRNFLITNVFLEQSRWLRCIKQRRITFFLTTRYRLVLLFTYQDQHLKIHLWSVIFSKRKKINARCLCCLLLLGSESQSKSNREVRVLQALSPQQRQLHNS